MRALALRALSKIICTIVRNVSNMPKTNRDAKFGNYMIGLKPNEWLPMSKQPESPAIKECCTQAKVNTILETNLRRIVDQQMRNYSASKLMVEKNSRQEAFEDVQNLQPGKMKDFYHHNKEVPDVVMAYQKGEEYAPQAKLVKVDLPAFQESMTRTNVVLPLKVVKLAKPFPDPVKVMTSRTVSDEEKAQQMFAESKNHRVCASDWGRIPAGVRSFSTQVINEETLADNHHNGGRCCHHHNGHDINGKERACPLCGEMICKEVVQILCPWMRRDPQRSLYQTVVPASATIRNYSSKKLTDFDYEEEQQDSDLPTRDLGFIPQGNEELQCEFRKAPSSKRPPCRPYAEKVRRDKNDKKRAIPKPRSMSEIRHSESAVRSHQHVAPSSTLPFVMLRRTRQSGSGDPADYASPPPVRLVVVSPDRPPSHKKMYQFASDKCKKQEIKKRCPTYEVPCDQLDEDEEPPPRCPRKKKGYNICPGGLTDKKRWKKKQKKTMPANDSDVVLPPPPPSSPPPPPSVSVRASPGQGSRFGRSAS